MDIYRSKYEKREPAFVRNPDECRALAHKHGVRQITNAPMNADDIVFGSMPDTRDDTSSFKTKYLWVIKNDSLPMILENSDEVRFLQSQRATHTNLTGCKEAYCGGELWFHSIAAIDLSGSSGRYAPRDEPELEEVCAAFRRLGYTVKSLGWNAETRRPRKYLRE